MTSQKHHGLTVQKLLLVVFNDNNTDHTIHSHKYIDDEDHVHSCLVA